MKVAPTVLGVHAPPARPTRAAAILLATLLSVPFALLSLAEFLFL